MEENDRCLTPARQNSSSQDVFEVPSTPMNCKGTPTQSSEEFEIPATPQLNLLGCGTGVNVWAMKKKANSSPWAVKSVRTFMEEKKQRNLQQLLDKEGSVLADIKHENIIGFRGMIQAKDGRRCLAMESCGKSLGDIVEERADDEEQFSPEEIKLVVRSVAKALDYLHTEKRLLHGDVKSFNILIKGNFEAVKLCDFGVCEELDENGEAESYLGTTVYNAPEVLNEDGGPITPKAETFSLGLVIWEMLALQVPFAGGIDTETSHSEDTRQSEESILDDMVYGVRLPPPPGLEKSFDSILKVYYACTEQDPKARPSASDVIKMLD